jgi:hypothetical protein
MVEPMQCILWCFQNSRYLCSQHGARCCVLVVVPVQSISALDLLKLLMAPIIPIIHLHLQFDLLSEHHL